MNMKNVFKYIVLLFGVVAFAASCSDDQNVEYTWPEEESGLKLWFAEDAATSYELADNQSSVSLYMYRNQTAGELTVELDASCLSKEAYTSYDENGNPLSCLFFIPNTVTFAAGSDVAQIRILFTYSEIQPEFAYKFVAAVKDPANHSSYGAAGLEFTIAAYPDWASAGWGTFDIGSHAMFTGIPPFSSYQPIQNKAGTNFYRLPNFAAYWMENNYDACVALGYTDEEYEDELEYLWTKNEHIVFQLNNSSLSDGGKEWDFYNMAKGAQDKGSFLYGASVYDYFIGTHYFLPFCTKNYNAGLAKYCYFTNDSSVNRQYIIQTLMADSATGGVYMPGAMVFDWVENPAVGDAWQISTNYNVDFSYGEAGSVVNFTPSGFPELGSYEVLLQESPDKQNLFRLKDAFGVAEYGLAFFVNDNKVVVPADQPTGRVQNGMMVYAGPGGASEIDKDGNLKLSLEYYMIEEKVTMPEEEADKLPVAPEGTQPAVDPDDNRFEWPSGVVGQGERYEVVPPAPESPAQDPKPIVTTRRISIGSFEEHATTSGAAYATIDQYVGDYVIVGMNYGPYYLGNYASYYPSVGAHVTLNVKVVKGEGDDELKISGLFSNIPNGDALFTPGSVKDTVTGIYNKLGGYVLIHPQTLSEKVTILGDAETGKPDREYTAYFAGFDIKAEETTEYPVMMYRTEAGIAFDAASAESSDTAAFVFYSDYDDELLLNYDIPYLPASLDSSEEEE